MNEIFSIITRTDKVYRKRTDFTFISTKCLLFGCSTRNHVFCCYYCYFILFFNSIWQQNNQLYVTGEAHSSLSLFSQETYYYRMYTIYSVSVKRSNRYYIKFYFFNLLFPFYTIIQSKIAFYNL